MRRLTLPEFYSEKLSGSEHEVFTTEAISKCCRFIGDPTRGMAFFPEYTDHGIEHVQQVLDSTAGLIPDEAKPFVTATDVAIIVAAVLLHDSAMHMTADNFLAIVRSSDRPIVPD